MDSVVSQDAALSEALERYWGYTSFRPLQREAMDAILVGRDSIVVLPTGGGKSLCFQAPALVRHGLAVVVSPLISLMKDQVDTLVGNGVAAACYNSSLAPDQKSSVLSGLRDGRFRLLYVSPERLVGDGGESFLNLLADCHVSFVAIDEAHCISQWGHDFRPEYRQLGRLRTLLPGISLHAYTATATARVRRDIASQLGLGDPVELVGSFDRPNLVYRVLARANLKRQLTDVLVAPSWTGGHHLLHVAPRGRRAVRVAARDGRPRARLIMPGSPTTSAAGTRTRSSRKTPTSSSPRSRSAWASIAPTSASSCTPARRNRSSTISRSPAAPDATASRRSACSCTRPPTS